ncbi:MAG: pyridoxine 5'-phosphate synthase [Arenicella sp.]
MKPSKQAPKTEENTVLLGVNVDHVATLRQARGTDYPNPYSAVTLAQLGGADGITIHLREDRRHIVDEDVKQFCEHSPLPINLEMAATAEMLDIALKNKPTECCFVPEKREELTTEGGLDVVSQQARLQEYVTSLQSAGIQVSMFIDPDLKQIEACQAIGVDIVELHTGSYSECAGATQQAQLRQIKEAAVLADSLGLVVNAGHGLHYQNVLPIASIKELHCLNIGHSIIADAVFRGLQQSVMEMKKLLIQART